MKVVIFGDGPSLIINIEEFRLYGGDFHDAILLATDAALPKLLERRIVPDHVATLEDYPNYVKFFDNDLARFYKVHTYYSRKTSHDIKILLAKMDVEHELAPVIHKADVITNVGSFCFLIAAQILKADEIYLFGMDHSYGKGQRPKIKEFSQIWQRAIYTTFNPHIKQRIIMNPIHMLWREEFHRWMMENPKPKVINMTGWGSLFGKNIQWTSVKT